MSYDHKTVGSENASYVIIEVPRGRISARINLVDAQLNRDKILMGMHDKSEGVALAVLSAKYKFLTLLFQRDWPRSSIATTVTLARSNSTEQYEFAFNVTFESALDPVEQEIMRMAGTPKCHDTKGAMLTDEVIIDFGNSPSAASRTKDVSSLFHPNSAYRCEPHHPCCGDKFSVEVNGTSVRVLRSDKAEGWGQQLQLKCFRIETSFVEWNCTGHPSLNATRHSNTSCFDGTDAWNCTTIECRWHGVAAGPLDCNAWYNNLELNESEIATATAADEAATRNESISNTNTSMRNSSRHNSSEMHIVADERCSRGYFMCSGIGCNCKLHGNDMLHGIRHVAWH